MLSRDLLLFEAAKTKVLYTSDLLDAAGNLMHVNNAAYHRVTDLTGILSFGAFLQTLTIRGL